MKGTSRAGIENFSNYTHVYIHTRMCVCVYRASWCCNKVGCCKLHECDCREDRWQPLGVHEQNAKGNKNTYCQSQRNEQKWSTLWQLMAKWVKRDRTENRTNRKWQKIKEEPNTSTMASKSFSNHFIVSLCTILFTLMAGESIHCLHRGVRLESEEWTNDRLVFYIYTHTLTLYAGSIRRERMLEMRLLYGTRIHHECCMDCVCVCVCYPNGTAKMDAGQNFSISSNWMAVKASEMICP